MRFNERLRHARTIAGYTQEQVARELNVTLRSYQNYEQGRTSPSLSTLVELADLFQMPTDWLLCRDEYLASLGVHVDVPGIDLPIRPTIRIDH